MIALALTPFTLPWSTHLGGAGKAEVGGIDPNIRLKTNGLRIGDVATSHFHQLATKQKVPSWFWRYVGPSAVAAVVGLLAFLGPALVFDPISSLRSEMEKLRKAVRADISKLDTTVRNSASSIQAARNEIQATERRVGIVQDQIDRVIKVQIDDLQTKLKNLDARVTEYHKKKAEIYDLDRPVKHAVVTTEPASVAKVVAALKEAKAVADIKQLRGDMIRVISLYNGSQGSLQHFARPVFAAEDFDAMWKLTSAFERAGKGVYAFPSLESVPFAVGMTKVAIRAVDRKFSYSFLDNKINSRILKKELAIQGWRAVGQPVHIEPGLSYRGLVRKINATPGLFATPANE